MPVKVIDTKKRLAEKLAAAAAAKPKPKKAAPKAKPKAKSGMFTKKKEE